MSSGSSSGGSDGSGGSGGARIRSCGFWNVVVFSWRVHTSQACIVQGPLCRWPANSGCCVGKTHTSSAIKQRSGDRRQNACHVSRHEGQTETSVQPGCFTALFHPAFFPPSLLCIISPLHPLRLSLALQVASQAVGCCTRGGDVSNLKRTMAAGRAVKSQPSMSGHVMKWNHVHQRWHEHST